MKFSTAFTVLAASASIIAAPVQRDQSWTATDIETLQFALVLEHLEATYYTQFLEKYDANAFSDAGFSPEIFERFVQMKGHEVDHVNTLTAVIGPDAVQACEYSFPVTDVQSFISLSSVLENVGVSAYTGAAQFLTNNDHLTAAAAILSTEARQQTWVTSDVQHQNPWGGPFDTPLSLNQIFSLASPFIKSCPSTNVQLPVKAFPTLTASAPSSTFYCAGQTITLTFDCGNAPSTLFVAFISGLTTTFVPITNDKCVVLPSGLNGIVYAVVTSIGSGTLTDDVTVAGPVILNFGLDASAPQ